MTSGICDICDINIDDDNLAMSCLENHVFICNARLNAFKHKHNYSPSYDQVFNNNQEHYLCYV